MNVCPVKPTSWGLTHDSPGYAWGSRVGVTKPIFTVLFFHPGFHYYQNFGCLLNAMFIFDRCLRSWAAETHVKYEHDILLQNQNVEINQQCFSNPNPRCWVHRGLVQRNLRWSLIMRTDELASGSKVHWNWQQSISHFKIIKLKWKIWITVWVTGLRKPKMQELPRWRWY